MCVCMHSTVTMHNLKAYVQVNSLISQFTMMSLDMLAALFTFVT